MNYPSGVPLSNEGDNSRKQKFANPFAFSPGNRRDTLLLCTLDEGEGGIKNNDDTFQTANPSKQLPAVSHQSTKPNKNTGRKQQQQYLEQPKPSADLLTPGQKDIKLVALPQTQRLEFANLGDRAGRTIVMSAPTQNRGEGPSDREDVHKHAMVLRRRKSHIHIRAEAGDRAVSTANLLGKQDFQTDLHHKTYAVRSIRRGSQDWVKLLRPFVADLVFRSVVSRHYQSGISFRPYKCQAALLFVDLSGYSRIAAAIANRGAHVISEIVNEYLGRLLSIIHLHGGDVVKFAGDAVIVVWEGNEQDLEINVLCAARAAFELQALAGYHPVEGTNLSFQIHCGLCCGTLESEIVEAPSHVNMQRLYHSLGGDTMVEIGDLVEISKAGELCISMNCFSFLGRRGSYKDVPVPSGAKILEGLSLDGDIVDIMDEHIEKMKFERRQSRMNKNIEEEFIHRSVLEYLSHGGLSPTQIAQIRDLCVLFIAMTTHGDSVNWLMEVQAILDRNRCPIVQILDDDKGVHIVAAINLYEAVPETSLLGLQVCRELANKRVGASVGVAMGPTFCGVTGSDTACRWDITGPPVVRAARLMQYALNSGVEHAIDQSVYNDPMAASHMSVLGSAVSLKGTKASVAVYALSDSKLFSAFRILESVHGRVHNDGVQRIQNHIFGRRRCAVLVTGIPLAGKKIACQRAAGFSDLVPYLHRCEESAGFLQLARTIATWFQYVDDRQVQKTAKSVVEDLDKQCWSSAHDLCVALVNLALEKGFGACILVDRIQFLDTFSLSLIRECLQTCRAPRRTSEKKTLQRANSTDSVDCDENVSMAKICFLCVHVPLYNRKTAQDVVEDITRSHTSFNVPIVEIGEASKEELRSLFRDLTDMEVDDRLLDEYAKASGFCAGYFIERTVAIRNMSADLSLCIPPGLVRKRKKLTVTQIRTEIAMRFSQVYDELPPLCQMILKILTIATRNGFYRLPQTILWQVMNDLFSKGVDQNTLAILLGEMVEICLLKIENAGGDRYCEKLICIQNPALADIAMDVCIPIQVRSIATALIDRLWGAALTDNFQVTLVVAGLNTLLHQDGMEYLWVHAYQNFLEASRNWPQSRINEWKETFRDEIHAAGWESKDILGDEFEVSISPKPTVPDSISLLKMYSAPVSLGPLGHTFSVICRNTFHEFGAFHGANKESINKLRDSTGSACGRYMMEMSVLEDFLSENGFGTPSRDLEAEFNSISFLASVAQTEDDVEAKAVEILDKIVLRCVEPRLQRLYQLMRKLREGDDLPAVITKAQKAVKLAYEALKVPEKCRIDAGQDALMVLATMKWKPKLVPEYLPNHHYQTVANLRDKTLKRLNEAEVMRYRHQQTVDDLEAFLVVTSLLYQASENGAC